MESDPAFIDSATQAEIIHNLEEKLKTCYVFPEVADQICIRLQHYWDAGEYSQLNEGNLFALGLTLHLQDASHDEHLWVKWHPEALPEDEGQLRLNKTWQAERQQEARLDNFGFYKLERLPGGVGVVDIHYFHRPAWGGEAAVAAMGFLAGSQAIIFDLRQCTGGFPGMIALICSYLFTEEPVHLASIYWRDEDFTQQYWTYGYIPGKRFVEKPVYVLTSKDTFSGGEMFADILQTRKRATVIGEQTDGGANVGASYRLHPHFEAFIPIGRSINPLKNSNWEGTGVSPDIPIPQAQSITVAYKLALQSVLVDIGEATSEQLRKLADEAKAALGGLQAN